MKTTEIETKEPNFHVENPFRVKTSDKTTLKYVEGDGLRVAGDENKPFIECYVNESYKAFELNEKQFTELMGGCYHVTEYVERDLSLLEAMSDRSVLTDEIIESYKKSTETTPTKSRKKITVTKKVAELSIGDKSEKVLKESLLESKRDLLKVVDLVFTGATGFE